MRKHKRRLKQKYIMKRTDSFWKKSGLGNHEVCYVAASGNLRIKYGLVS